MAQGELDARRYPGFAALARDSTWFRNAHTIYDSTSKAVPAIMDGHLPEKGTLPTSSEHPDSIFALLGKSHRMNVSEEATSVCPRDLCEDARLDEPFVDRLTSMTEDLGLVYAHVVSPPGIEDDLPSVSETWGEFGGDTGGAQAATTDAGDRPNTRENLQGNRNNRFDAWIDSIRAGRPALNFKHALLPHVPWQYLPDGRQYRRTATEPIPGISRQSYRDQGQVDQLQLRHLLQVGFADLELRKTIRRLKQLGIYDDALIVVTADHGVSFKQGQFDRRNVNRGNIDEITPVPLFVKEPEQSRGRVDDAIVETTDVAPTVADLLGIERPEGVDGRSAFSDAVRRRREVRMLKRDLSGFVRVSGEELEREVAAEVAETARLFGTGADDARPDLPDRPQPGAGGQARHLGGTLGRARHHRGWRRAGRREPAQRHRARLGNGQGVRRRGAAQADRRGRERHGPGGRQHVPAGHRGRRAVRCDGAAELVPSGGQPRPGVRGQRRPAAVDDLAGLH